MTEFAQRRSWVRGILLAALSLALVALAFLFGAANGPQAISLTFGALVWRGEAVHALFAAFVAGLLVMFLVGLSTDFAARAERRRLERRIAMLERDVVRPRREAAPETRASTGPEPHATTASAPDPVAPEFARPLRNPGDAEAV